MEHRSVRGHIIKQTTLGGVSDIEKRGETKACNPGSGEAETGGFLGFTGHHLSLLGKSWANKIPYLKKIPPAIDGHKYRDPQLDSVQRLRDPGTFQVSCLHQIPPLSAQETLWQRQRRQKDCKSQ